MYREMCLNLLTGTAFILTGKPYLYKGRDNVKVKVAVKFIDNQTKATQVSQYELVLHKDSNWKIVG